MDRTRVLEIIAAYGADATRWPATEREAAQVLMARDGELQAAFGAAAALDVELAAWAAAPVAVGDVDATTAADNALLRVPAPRRWWSTAVLGGSVAASLLAAVVLLPGLTGEPASNPGQVAQTSSASVPVQMAQVEQDVQAVSTVFTLTPEEESLI